CTTTGGWDSRLARGGINDPDNVFPGGYLLIDLFRSSQDKNNELSIGKDVVLAGGGESVLEAVNILKDLGVQKITILSRKDPESSSLNNNFIEKLTQQGATIVYNSGITKVMGREDALTGIEYVELSTKEKHTMDADTLIISSGRYPELVFRPVFDKADDDEAADGNEEEPIWPLTWEGVELPKKPDNSKELGMLSDQDILSEYSSVVSAINGGRKTATTIHNLMYNIDFQDNSNVITEKSNIQGIEMLHSVDTIPRHIMEADESKQGLKDNFSSGFSIEDADAEANRCLRCGIVCYEKSKGAIQAKENQP
ncbi:MAG: FAD-dependent oxidoreductase, partial [Desulfobacteraceae bacterium]|nr:FAD-dependent oxidoreductase [Desulfobacteraceae bacterium]